MKERFTKMGAVIAGLFAAACCLGPAVFTVLGIGVGATGLLAGIAGFTKVLIPYRPFFIILAIGFIAGSFYLVYGRSRTACCASGEMQQQLKRQKIGLWIITAIVVALILSPYWL